MKLISRIIVICSCLCCGRDLMAQHVYEGIVNFPLASHLHYLNRDDDIARNDHGYLETFFYEFREWSKLYEKGVTVNEEYNAIFVRHFMEKYNGNNYNHKYIVLPARVIVTKYDCDIRPHIGYGAKVPLADVPASQITEFTPVLDAGKEVVYLSDLAEELLREFVDAPMYVKPYLDSLGYEHRKVLKHGNITDKDAEERNRRIQMLQQYIPAIKSCWGTGDLVFLTYPNILCICVGKDGYIINIEYGIYYGNMYFVPWNGKPEMIEEWIS